MALLAETFFARWRWKAAGTLVFLGLLELLWVTGGARRTLPFERAVDMGIVPVLFLLALLAVIFYSVTALDGCFTRSKSIYTLMTLPVPRRDICFGALAACGAGVLLLWGAQLLWLAVIYGAANGGLDYGLALAFDHSAFLRFLLPRTAAEAMAAVSFALALICAAHHMVFQRAGLFFEEQPLLRIRASIPAAAALALGAAYLAERLLGPARGGALQILFLFCFALIAAFSVRLSLSALGGRRAWSPRKEAAS